jgi:hypothetical protein
MHFCEVVRIETFLRLDYLCVLRVHTPGNGIIAPRLKKMSEFNGSAPTFSPEGKFLFFMKNRDIHWVSAKIIEELRPKKYQIKSLASLFACVPLILALILLDAADLFQVHAPALGGSLPIGGQSFDGVF